MNTNPPVARGIASAGAVFWRGGVGGAAAVEKAAKAAGVNGSGLAATAFVDLDGTNGVKVEIFAGRSRGDVEANNTGTGDTGNGSFTIDASGRPELSIYKDIVFEVSKDCKTFNPEEAKTDWGMVNLEKVAGSKDKYKVKFSYPLSGPLRTYEVIAQPVKDGNMEEAMKKYGMTQTP